MTELRIGRLVVTGTDIDIEIAKRAYANQRPAVKLQDYLDRDFRVEFHTAEEFIARGAILPGSKTARRPRGRAAWGYAFPNALWINSDRTEREQIYVARHEPGHPIVSRFLTRTKAAAIRNLVARTDATNPYPNRLSEVLCDSAVELFWGRGSILDEYYGDIADRDLQKAWDILVRPTGDEPDPPDPIDVEPIPLPLPDPRITVLETEVATLKRRIAGKDAKLQEGLLL